MIKEKIRKLPDTPGVYLMKSKEGKVLYVGKASSLRKRVLSHFSSSSLKRDIFLKQVAGIDYLECDTEEQALILEASLIKEKRPKYNISLRDDKSYPFVAITHEKFPRLFITRPKSLRISLGKGDTKESGSRQEVFVERAPKIKYRLFGPYPQAKTLKSALNLVRKVFPYRSCKRLPPKPCLFFHLHLCPAPCIKEVAAAKYREMIENICKVLKGERKKLIQDLEKKMVDYAKELRFEEAKLVREELFAVSNLYPVRKGSFLQRGVKRRTIWEESKAPSKFSNGVYWGKRQINELVSLKNILNLPNLPLVIEAIDISSLAGQEASGSVVVFRDGICDKSSYRRFKIKEAAAGDDYGMIAEVVRRRYWRLKKEEKKLPDLIVIDGGIGHAQKAKSELDKLGVNIPLIGIAKRKEEIWFPGAKDALPRPYKGRGLLIPKDSPCLHLIQRIRDQAHRFAHKYHLWRRRKKVIR